MHFRSRGLLVVSSRFALFTILSFLSLKANAQFGPSYGRSYGGNDFSVGQMIVSAILGAILGAFFSEKFKQYRKWVWLAIGVILLIIAIKTSSALADIAAFIAGFIAAYKFLRDKVKGGSGKADKPTTFGSAEWADLAEINRMRSDKIIGSDGLFLGLFDAFGQKTPLYYTGQRHLLTVAPTRAGKGVTAIIPNLLTYQGSALVIDPKGENAKITALRRGAGDPVRNMPGLGQEVHVVDPWGITKERVSRFNPLDLLDPDDQDLTDNAMMLADSLLYGFLLYVATAESEQESRTLGRVRDLIVMGGGELRDLLEQMAASSHPVVQSTASRHAGKDPETAANVMSSLQSHTHFLDNPRIRESLSHSDFRFQDMKHNPMTVYLVLPADRLDTFGRWLRLLVQQAITLNARNIEREPAKPILFMLDEMAALGKLTMVEQAFGLMAGFGMQLWGIVQDVSQLERIYGTGWETFIGNSGVLQYLGSRDQKTAEYFSKLCGVSTIVKTSISRSIARAFGQGGGSTTHSDSTNTDHIQRHLAFPDELMVFRRDQVLLLVENYNPINGKRVRWFDDPKLKPLGLNLKETPRLSA